MCLVTCLFTDEWHLRCVTIGTVRVIDVSVSDLDWGTDGGDQEGKCAEMKGCEGMEACEAWRLMEDAGLRLTSAMKLSIYLTFSWIFSTGFLSRAPCLFPFLFLLFPMAGMSCVGFICHGLLVAVSMCYWCEVCVCLCVCVGGIEAGQSLSTWAAWWNETQLVSTNTHTQLHYSERV